MQEWTLWHNTIFDLSLWFHKEPFITTLRTVLKPAVYSFMPSSQWEPIQKWKDLQGKVLWLASFNFILNVYYVLFWFLYFCIFNYIQVIQNCLCKLSSHINPMTGWLIDCINKWLLTNLLITALWATVKCLYYFWSWEGKNQHYSGQRIKLSNSRLRKEWPRNCWLRMAGKKYIWADPCRQHTHVSPILKKREKRVQETIGQIV